MSRFRVLFGWPGPRWLFPAAGGLMAVGSFLMTRSLLSAEYVTWAAVSGAWHESLWLPGSVAAAGAAFLGAGCFQRGSAVASPVRPRVGPVLILTHGLALAGWLCLGHVVGMVPVEVAAVEQATAGALSPQAVVIALAGLTTLTVLGFGLGAAVGHWLIAPFVGVLSFVAMGLSYGPDFRAMGVLLPVHHRYMASPEFEVGVAATVFAVAASVAFCLLAGALASWSIARGSVRRGTGTSALVSLGTMATLVGIAFAWNPQLYVVDKPVPQVCRNAGGVQVCLHQANVRAFADVSEVVTSMRAAGLAPLVTKVTGYDVHNRHQLDPGQILVSVDPGPRSPSLFADSLREKVALDLGETAVTLACDFEKSMKRHARSDALMNRVYTIAGFSQLNHDVWQTDDPGVQAIARMNAKEVREFIAHHQKEVRSCGISPDDLTP